MAPASGRIRFVASLLAALVLCAQGFARDPSSEKDAFEITPTLPRVAFSADGRRVAALSETTPDTPARVAIFDRDNRAIHFGSGAYATAPTAFAYAHKNTRRGFLVRQMAVGERDATISLWDADSNRQMGSLQGHHAKVNSLVFSRDNSRLLSASDDRTAILWNVDAYVSMATFKSSRGPVIRAEFLGNQWVALASENGGVHVFEMTSGLEVRTFAGLRGSELTALAVSEHGNLMATALEDATVQLWATGSGTLLRTLRGHDRAVEGLSFVPDGRLLASASRDGRVLLWDANSGMQVGSFAGHGADVMDVAFSPSGLQLATTSLDHTIRLWDVGSRSEIERFVFDEDTARSAVADWSLYSSDR